MNGWDALLCLMVAVVAQQEPFSYPVTINILALPAFQGDGGFNIFNGLLRD